MIPISSWNVGSSALYTVDPVDPSLYPYPEQLRLSLNKNFELYLESFRYVVTSGNAVAQLSLALCYAETFLNLDYGGCYTKLESLVPDKLLLTIILDGYCALSAKAFPYSEVSVMERKELAEKQLQIAAREDFPEAQLAYLALPGQNIWHHSIELRRILRGNIELYQKSFRDALTNNNFVAQIALSSAYAEAIFDKDDKKDYTNSELTFHSKKIISFKLRHHFHKLCKIVSPKTPSKCIHSIYESALCNAAEQRLEIAIPLYDRIVQYYSQMNRLKKTF